MNCNEIREKISCMLDGQLSAEDSAIVAEHLAECPECMRAFEAFHAISIAMEELEDVPAGFTEDVMTRIRKSNTTPTPKKRPMSIFRTAGMVAAAACAALVLMAGTKFANTHMYVGGGTADTAEYVQLQRATPTPAATQQISFISDNAAVDTDDRGADVAEHTDIQDAVNEESINAAPTMTMNVDLTAQPPMAIDGEAPIMDPTESTPPMETQAPVPPPAVTATPIPQMELLFVEDLLLVYEEAAFDLFEENPAYEVTVTAEDGTEVMLKIWLDGERIYCKDEAAGTAWYTFGTPAQLATLLGEPAAMPTP